MISSDEGLHAGGSVTAAVYLRLSKEDKGESIENQRMILQRYCARSGFNIVKEYTDEALSGLYDSRPAFKRMLLDAEKGCFDVIVAKSQSRFSRNFLHVEQYLHQEFKRLNVRFIGVADGVDTGNGHGKKARQIYALINEWYCQDLSENVRTVLREKVRRGDFIGSFAPYGYEKSSENPHRLVKKYPQAKAVKLIFEGYAAGKTAKELAVECERLGLQPAGKQKGWNARQIYRILDNECYTGTIVQGKSCNASYKDKTRIRLRRTDWVRVEGVHEPIVTRELFEAVQHKKSLHGRRKKT